MKTPMQELLERVKEYRDSETDYFVKSRLNSVCVDIVGMLEKEEKVMCQFQSDGQRKDFWVKYEDNEDCFNKTFKTKER